MSAVLLVVMLLMLLGPLRRLCVGNATFVLPAAAGAIAGYLLGLFALSTGLPYPWLPWLWAALGAFFLGEAGSEWFRRVFRR